MIYPNNMLSKRHSDTSEDEASPQKPRRTRKIPPKDSDEYKERRARNNLAVRKSREQSRAKAKATMERVNFLKMENEKLEGQLTTLSKELSVLKDLFKMVHTNGINNTMACALPGGATSVSVQTIKPVIKQERAAIVEEEEEVAVVPMRTVDPVEVPFDQVGVVEFEVATTPLLSAPKTEYIKAEEPSLVIDAGHISTETPTTPVNTDALRKDHEYSRFSK